MFHATIQQKSISKDISMQIVSMADATLHFEGLKPMSI